VRDGELITEDDVKIGDWLKRLELFQVSREDFDSAREKLSKKFGKLASVNDTIWLILNVRVGKYGNDLGILEQIYREMAGLVSSEDRNPSRLLEQIENIRNRNMSESKNEKLTFMGHDELAKIRKLRKDGKLEKAEGILLKAEPSPAVLDELRKIASEKAKSAKRVKDWVSVVKYLEGYNEYAVKWRDYCVSMVNQEPPFHTTSDLELLQEAKAKLEE
jgi:hypothetical protein